jgi:hypothetical protein
MTALWKYCCRYAGSIKGMCLNALFVGSTSATCQFISITYHQANHMEEFAFHNLGPVLSSGWWSSFESSQGRLDFKHHYSIMYEMWHGHKASHYTMWYQSACKAAKNCHMNSKIFRNLGRLYSGLGRGRDTGNFLRRSVWPRRCNGHEISSSRNIQKAGQDSHSLTSDTLLSVGGRS